MKDPLAKDSHKSSSDAAEAAFSLALKIKDQLKANPDIPVQNRTELINQATVLLVSCYNTSSENNLEGTQKTLLGIILLDEMVKTAPERELFWRTVFELRRPATKTSHDILLGLAAYKRLEAIANLPCGLNAPIGLTAQSVGENLRALTPNPLLYAQGFVEKWVGSAPVAQQQGTWAAIIETAAMMRTDSACKPCLDKILGEWVQRRMTGAPRERTKSLLGGSTVLPLSADPLASAFSPSCN